MFFISSFCSSYDPYFQTLAQDTTSPSTNPDLNTNTPVHLCPGNPNSRKLRNITGQPVSIDKPSDPESCCPPTRLARYSLTLFSNGTRYEHYPVSHTHPFRPGGFTLHCWIGLKNHTRTTRPLPPPSIDLELG